jgi:hypothetical protein
VVVVVALLTMFRGLVQEWATAEAVARHIIKAEMHLTVTAMLDLAELEELTPAAAAAMVDHHMAQAALA